MNFELKKKNKNNFKLFIECTKSGTFDKNSSTELNNEIGDVKIVKRINIAVLATKNLKNLEAPDI